jgi:hypothetical protein
MPASCNKDMIGAGRDRGTKSLSQVGEVDNRERTRCHTELYLCK